MAEDLFECINLVEQAYPDDIGLWPGMYRTAAYAARDRLLDRSPGLRVVGERSYCIDKDDPRFPENGPDNLTHVLIYEVKLAPSLRLVE